MNVAIMQPYLFPYIGYFQLINYVDRWVVFDDTQYISKGWINRNRILHPDLKKEWQFITVPIKKHSRESRINKIEINDDIDWRHEILGKLTSYKKKAPYYKQALEFVAGCLENKSEGLSEWVVHTLRETCFYLDVPFRYSLFSEMSIDTDNVEHPGQWALEIAASMGAKAYINPPGGYEIFKESEFSDRNIDLLYMQANLTPYVQRRGGFVPGLSIVDVMMWNDVAAIKEMLRDFTIKTHSDLQS